MFGGVTMSISKINQRIKHLTLLLFIGLAWGQAEAERFFKSYRANINQPNIDNFNITASSEEYFKERGISKLKTTNENYGKGSIIKANDYQIRFIAKPKLFHRAGAYLIDIESIEEITLVPENYGKFLKNNIQSLHSRNLLFHLFSKYLERYRSY